MISLGTRLSSDPNIADILDIETDDFVYGLK